MDRFVGWQDGEVLDELDERGENLTPWEIEFVESLTQRMKRGEDLTEKQREKLHMIAEERVSP